jgi:hypothetical protein
MRALGLYYTMFLFSYLFLAASFKIKKIKLLLTVQQAKTGSEGRIYANGLAFCRNGQDL